MLVLVGAFTEYVIVTSRQRAERIDGLSSELVHLRDANLGLRSRLVFTLRSPLSDIIGNSDRMINTPDLDLQQRTALLEAIRDNAREVDGVLADLGEAHSSSSEDPRTEGVVLLDQEVRSVINAVGPNLEISHDLKPTRAWADSALVRQILRTVLSASDASGCTELTVRTEERSDRATVTFSSGEAILPIEGVAALTGNSQESDTAKTSFVALREAYESAADMGGTVGYATALGMTHVIVEFVRAPGTTDGTRSESRPPASEFGPAPILKPTFMSAVDFRPERPTASIRFG